MNDTEKALAFLYRFSNRAHGTAAEHRTAGQAYKLLLDAIHSKKEEPNAKRRPGDQSGHSGDQDAG